MEIGTPIPVLEGDEEQAEPDGIRRQDRQRDRAPALYQDNGSIERLALAPLERCP